MARTVVLGVGNTILTDDGIGIHVARRAQALLVGTDVEVRETERGGLDVIELVTGFQRLVLVDAYLLPGEAPGTVVRRRLEDFGDTLHMFGAHGVDLPTALRLGAVLGEEMPGEVHIVGIVPENPYALGETMTPAVEAALEPAARLVADLAVGNL